MALFSVAVQGTLIPTVARKLDLIDDEESVLKIFNDYKGYILASHPAIKCSQFEEVILKILNDEEKSSMYTEHGITITPFMRYLALIKIADMTCKFKYIHPNVKDELKINLKGYLFMFIAGHNDKIKNNLIRRIIHQYFSDM